VFSLKGFFDEFVSLFCFRLYGSFNDSLRSAVDRKSVSWVLSCLYFSIFTFFRKKEKNSFSSFLFFKHIKKKKNGFLFS
jgi:hypothetical protein